MRANLFGVGIDALGMEETVAHVAGLVSTNRPAWVMTLNPEYLYRARFDHRLWTWPGGRTWSLPTGKGLSGPAGWQVALFLSGLPGLT